jgi:sodium-independent sulfate anion transporter 11
VLRCTFIDAFLITLKELVDFLYKMSLNHLTTIVRRKVFNIEPHAGRHEKALLEKDAKSTIIAPYVEEEPSITQWLLGMRPTYRKASSYARSIFPFTTWIMRYNLTWLLGDGIAGKNALSRNSRDI